MKKEFFVLVGAAIAVVFLLAAVQPALAGSDKSTTSPALGQKAGAATQSEKININTANLKILSSLKGIGPERAKRIIDYRSKNGSFKSIEEIKKVKGIGDRVYTQISSQICVK